MQFVLFVRTAWKCGKPPKLVRLGFLIDNLGLLMSGSMPDYLLQIPDWAWWCSIIFWTGFKLKNQPVNLKFQDAGITEAVHFYHLAWVSYCVVKSSRGPLWRLACAPCSRWLNKLWLLFSPLPEYLFCQKEGCMKLKIWMLFPWHETAKWFQKKYHSLCLKFWKYLCLYLKMAFPRVAM